MADNVFRTPVSHTEAPIPEAQNPDVPHSVDKTTPISLYQELRGMPYSAEYFEVKEIWNSDKLTLKEDLRLIDEYYKNKVWNNEYQDNKKSFEVVIKEAKKVTNCENAPVNIQIAKIAEWAKFMNRIRDIDKLHELYND